MFESNIQLNDSEIDLIDKKVVQWAKSKQGTRMSIDQFAKDVEEKLNHCGFTCEVKVYDTEQGETWAFKIEINGRTGDTKFDPDKQVHEVVNNYLQLPGEDKGWIKSSEAAKKLQERGFKLPPGH